LRGAQSRKHWKNIYRRFHWQKQENGSSGKIGIILNLLATLVNAYYEMKEYQKAAAFAKALEAEPEFEWVRNTLYPQTLKKSIHNL